VVLVLNGIACFPDRHVEFEVNMPQDETQRVEKQNEWLQLSSRVIIYCNVRGKIQKSRFYLVSLALVSDVDQYDSYLAVKHSPCRKQNQHKISHRT
jgi:hypothetical protein